jgi:hypothetical protein
LNAGCGCVGQRMNFFFLSLFLFILSCPTFISAERSFVLLDSSKQDQDESRLLFFEPIILRRLNEPSNEPKNVTNCTTEGNKTKDEGHGRRLNEPVGPKCDEKEYVPPIPFWQIWLIFIACGVVTAGAVFVVWYYKEHANKPLPSSEVKDNPAIVAQKRSKELENSRINTISTSTGISLQSSVPISTPSRSGKKNSRNVGEVVDFEKEREIAAKSTAAFTLPPPPYLPSSASSYDSTKSNEYLEGDRGGADPVQVDITVRESAAAIVAHQRRLDRIAAATNTVSVEKTNSIGVGAGVGSLLPKKREFAPQTSGNIENNNSIAASEEGRMFESQDYENEENGGSIASVNSTSRNDANDDEVYNAREIEASLEFAENTTTSSSSSSSSSIIAPIAPSIMPRINIPSDLPKIPAKPRTISIPKPVVKSSSSSSSSSSLSSSSFE